MSGSRGKLSVVSSVSLGLRTEGPWAALLPLLIKSTAQARSRPAFDGKADIAKWRRMRLLMTLTLLLSH